MGKMHHIGKKPHGLDLKTGAPKMEMGFQAQHLGGGFRIREGTEIHTKAVACLKSISQ